MPSEKQVEEASVKMTENDPSLNQPKYQIMSSIDSVEKSITRKVDELDKLGAEQYINKQLKKEQSENTGQTELAAPENKEPIASIVVSSNEPKVKPRVPKKTKLLPIIEHEQKPKKMKKSYKSRRATLEEIS